MSPTLKVIADRSNVSIRTVSRILNTDDAHLFRPETCERVIRVASEMGYRRNMAAQAMVSGRTGSIMMVFPTGGGGGKLPRGFIFGSERELTLQNKHLILRELPDEELTSLASVPRILSQHAADGLIFGYVSDIPPVLPGLLRRFRIPSTWLNVVMPADCVHPDDAGAGRTATERLLTLGHRRIAFAGPTDGPHYSVAARWQGYVSAMREAGLSPRSMQIGDHAYSWSAVPLDQRLAVAREVMRMPDRPTAVLAASPSEAYPLLYAAALEGVKVPDQFSLITIHDEPANAVGLAIDTMHVSLTKLGRRAVTMVLEKIEQPHVPIPPVVEAYEYKSGATTAPPSNP